MCFTTLRFDYQFYFEEHGNPFSSRGFYFNFNYRHVCLGMNPKLIYECLTKTTCRLSLVDVDVISYDLRLTYMIYPWLLLHYLVTHMKVCALPRW